MLYLSKLDFWFHGADVSEDSLDGRFRWFYVDVGFNECVEFVISMWWEMNFWTNNKIS